MEKAVRLLVGLLALFGAFGAMSAAAQGATAEIMAQWDAAERIRLWPEAPPGGVFVEQPERPDAIPNFITNVTMPELRVFRPTTPNGRSLLAIPGGAYRFVSIANEGVEVANAMTAKGYTVFVLVYRLPGEGWSEREDVPLQDAQRAVRIIRAESAKFGLDPESLYAVGFSAGGHLAATLATGFDEDVYAPVDAADELSARPKGAGLIYPVISHVPGVGHAESSRLLLGENPPTQRIAKRSPALHVGNATPPVFIMHAIDDEAVPVANSLLMIDALRAAKRPVEAHLFEEGGHGFGLGPADLPAAQWIELFANWIERQQDKGDRGEGQ